MSVERARGTRFESEVAAYMRDHGFPNAERRALAGGQDKGDITGIAGLVVEAKSCKRIELAAWMDETHTETVNAKADLGILVIKRRGKGVARSYCVLELDALCLLLRDIYGAGA